ncbi:hypothetical protein [Streptomyces nitrosporeus]|uniref:hypothetical protein n=1 Tax=Streptomyces nitrosporeus TaxID=28894 RepID=UPI00333237BF
MTIEINAADRQTAQRVVTQVVGLWLSSTTPVRPVPGQGFRAMIYADFARSPEEGGLADEAEPARTGG